MAGAVQWTIDQFWSALQSLKNQITAVDSKLTADKARLTQLYSFARQEYDPAGAYDRALLQPLIHQNSVLRLTYLKPVKDKFNEAVAAASSALRKAGYSTPGLSGLGVVPALIIVPVAAVTALGLAVAAVKIVDRLTQAQINRTQAIKDAIGKGWTPTQVSSLLDQQKAELDAERRANPPLVDWGGMAVLAGVIAVIILGPTVLKMVQGRRAEA